MMDRLDNLSKLKCNELAEELKTIMRPLYEKHRYGIITGHFSETMMADWDSNDVNLRKWPQETAETNVEKTPAGDVQISEQEYFDNAVVMVARCNEMNKIVSDAAEDDCYLYTQACIPPLKDFMAKQVTFVIGREYNAGDNGVDNRLLVTVNAAIHNHPVEVGGRELRSYMTAVQKIAATE